MGRRQLVRLQTQLSYLQEQARKLEEDNMHHHAR